MRKDITDIYKDVMDIVLPVKIVEQQEIITDNQPVQLSKKSTIEINGIALLAKKYFLNNFPNSEVVITNEFKNVILTYAKDNDIIINSENFFYCGELKKFKNQFNAFGPAYSIDGSKSEEDKYNLIKELYWKIEEYKKFNNYFKAIDHKFYLQLALSNFGTNFDEDIDVKLFISKDMLCKNNQLPIPDDLIVKIINRLFYAMFKPKKTVYVDEYSNYQTVKKLPMLPSFGIYGY